MWQVTRGPKAKPLSTDSITHLLPPIILDISQDNHEQDKTEKIAILTKEKRKLEMKLINNSNKRANSKEVTQSVAKKITTDILGSKVIKDQSKKISQLERLIRTNSSQKQSLGLDKEDLEALLASNSKTLLDSFESTTKASNVKALFLLSIQA